MIKHGLFGCQVRSSSFDSERMRVVCGTFRTFVQGKDGLIGGCVCYNLLVFVGAAKPDQNETNFMADSRD